jgi:hypothetical protein
LSIRPLLFSERDGDVVVIRPRRRYRDPELEASPEGITFMKFHTVSLGVGKIGVACRAWLIAIFALVAAGLLHPAHAGCLDVHGMKIPAVDLKDPFNLGSPRFVKSGFQEEDLPLFFFNRAQIVGLWAFKYVSEGNMTTLGIPDGVQIDGGSTLWFADGNEITYSGMRNPIVGATCLGVWKQTGEHTYVLNHIGLSWDVQAPSPSGPASNNNPGGGPGAPGGPAFIKQYVTLANDGQTYSGTFTISQLMPDGKTLATPAPIKGKITATRVTIDTTTQEP